MKPDFDPLPRLGWGFWLPLVALAAVILACLAYGSLYPDPMPPVTPRSPR